MRCGLWSAGGVEWVKRRRSSVGLRGAWCWLAVVAVGLAVMDQPPAKLDWVWGRSGAVWMRQAGAPGRCTSASPGRPDWVRCACCVLSALCTVHCALSKTLWRLGSSMFNVSVCIQDAYKMHACMHACMCEQAVANNWSVSPLSSLSSQLIVVHRRSPLDLLALTGLVAVAGADADADADVKDFSSRPALAASPSAAAMSVRVPCPNIMEARHGPLPTPPRLFGEFSPELHSEPEGLGACPPPRKDRCDRTCQQVA